MPDLSSVWIVCDAYENDLPSVHLGDAAEIRLNAYPDLVLRGRVSNIGLMLDPNLRTAKVRIEVQNPGIMRIGMFVQATFRGQHKEVHTAVPAAAIVHIHDRDFVYLPAPDSKFRRVEVVDQPQGGFVEDLPGVRQGHAARRAPHKLGAEMNFQGRHLLADSGLADAGLSGAGGEAAAVHHADEQTHRIQPIHSPKTSAED